MATKVKILKHSKIESLELDSNAFLLDLQIENDKNFSDALKKNSERHAEESSADLSDAIYVKQNFVRKTQFIDTQVIYYMLITYDCKLVYLQKDLQLETEQEQAVNN